MRFFTYRVNGRRVSESVARDIAEIYLVALETAALRIGKAAWRAGPKVLLEIEAK